jgi:6-phosphogluconolactonase
MAIQSVAFRTVTCLLLAGVFTGCGGGTNFVNPASLPGPTPPSSTTLEFLYATGVKQIAKFPMNVTTGALDPSSIISGPSRAGGMIADPLGEFLYVSDSANGVIDAFAIDQSTGALSPITGSPFAVASGSEPSGVAMDSHGRFLFVANATQDNIFVFSRDPQTGALTLGTDSPFATGASPLQVAVGPSDKFLYVSNHNDRAGSISAYTINFTTGALTPTPRSPFPTQPGGGPGGLVTDLSGNFLYVALQGTTNTNHLIAAFTIDASTGVLTTIAGSPFSAGNGPARLLAGRFLYATNSRDSTVSGFTINTATGVLTAIAGVPASTGPTPVPLVVDPTGTFLYVGNSGASSVSGFNIGSATTGIGTGPGILTPIVGSAFAGVTQPTNLAIVKIQ